MDIVSIFSAPQIDHIFWRWWCLSSCLFGSHAACTSLSRSFHHRPLFLNYYEKYFHGQWPYLSKQDNFLTNTKKTGERMTPLLFHNDKTSYFSAQPALWIQITVLALQIETLTKKVRRCLFWHWKHVNQTMAWSTDIKVPQKLPKQIGKLHL